MLAADPLEIEIIPEKPLAAADVVAPMDVLAAVDELAALDVVAPVDVASAVDVAAAVDALAALDVVVVVGQSPLESSQTTVPERRSLGIPTDFAMAAKMAA
jgi:hypothetical protein